MTRTLDEIREMYNRPAFCEMNLWGGYADAATLLDYVVDLETKIATWKNAENSPPCYIAHEVADGDEGDA